MLVQALRGDNMNLHRETFAFLPCTSLKTYDKAIGPSNVTGRFNARVIAMRRLVARHAVRSLRAFSSEATSILDATSADGDIRVVSSVSVATGNRAVLERRQVRSILIVRAQHFVVAAMKWLGPW
jgi:hypothetical protein